MISIGFKGETFHQLETKGCVVHAGLSQPQALYKAHTAFSALITLLFQFNNWSIVQTIMVTAVATVVNSKVLLPTLKTMDFQLRKSTHTWPDPNHARKTTEITGFQTLSPLQTAEISTTRFHNDPFQLW